VTTLSGIPASSGAAVGPFFLLNTNIPVPTGQPSHQSFEAEGHALNLAIKNVGLDLEARAARTTGELQEILLATAEIATDPAIVLLALELLKLRNQMPEQQLQLMQQMDR